MIIPQVDFLTYPWYTPPPDCKQSILQDLIYQKTETRQWHTQFPKSQTCESTLSSPVAESQLNRPNSREKGWSLIEDGW